MFNRLVLLVLMLVISLSGCIEQTPSAIPPQTLPVPTLTTIPIPTPTGLPTLTPTLSPAATLDTSNTWWYNAVFYQIFVRSFYDSNADGIGDFNGITQKLDYLNDVDPTTTTDLGINAIWLMPIMDSPSEHGYNVRDFYAVNPQYGTMDDFKELLARAHERGMHVIIDFIIHNTSVEHPWFIQSKDPSSPYRNWYIWSEVDPGWRGPWGQQVWYPLNNDYIYAYFWEGSPNLNLTNPEVTAELLKLTTFWLNDVGVDGFRLDAIGILIHEGSTQTNTPATHRWLKDFHDYYKGLKSSAFTVGEIWDKNEVVIPYVQNGEIDLAFNFDLAFAIIRGLNEANASVIIEQVNKGRAMFPKGQYGIFSANHDMDRLLTQLNSDPQKAKAAASITLTLPGVPFIYYGEEIGLKGYAPDSGGRLPMQWSGEQNSGFSVTTAWLPPGEDFKTFNVQNEQGKPLSLLTHYQKLIALRNQSEVMRRGEVFTPGISHPEVYCTLSVLNGEAILVIVNLSDHPVTQYHLSLASSSLPAGQYSVTNLFGNPPAKNVTINVSGGFESYAPSNQVPSFGTLIYHLGKK